MTSDARVVRAFWALTGALVLLRLAVIGRFELYGDEALYALYAAHPAWCHASNPPLIGWLIWLGTRFGNGEFFVRLVPSLAGSAVGVVLFFWAARGEGRRTGLAANALLLLVPLFWLLGLMATVDVPLVLAWTAATWALEEAVARGRARAWVWLGVALGIGVLAKLLVALFAIPIAAAVLLIPAGRRALGTKEPWIGLGLAAAISAPVWGWNLAHGMASLRMRAEQHWGDAPAEIFTSAGSSFGVSQVVIWTPVILGAALVALACDLRQGLRDTDGLRLLRALSGLTPFAVFAVVAALGTDVHPYWTAAAGPAAMLALASRLRAWGARTTPARRLAAWMLLAAPSLLAAAVLAFALAARLDAVPLPAAAREFARTRLAIPERHRRDLGERARRVLDTLPRGSFLCATDSFAPISRLAFYAGVPDRVALLHATGLARQFDAWRPADLAGRDAVCVVDRHDVAFPFAAYFEDGAFLPGNGPDERLFVGRGFRGFATHLFDPVPRPVAEDLTRRLYRGIFRRDADPGGFAHAAAEIERGRLRLILNGMAGSPEANPVGLADRLVEGMLGRRARPDERTELQRVAAWAGPAGAAARLIDGADLRRSLGLQP